MKLKEHETQINMVIPKKWKYEFEKNARILSYEQDRTISYLDLMRLVLQDALKRSGSI